MMCPRCGWPDAYAFRSRAIFKCRACGRQFSATSGDPVRRATKMTADQWSVLETHFRDGWPALRAYKETGISYRTCWLTWKRLRDAVDRSNSPEKA